jgi:hypothetical protein
MPSVMSLIKIVRRRQIMGVMIWQTLEQQWRDCRMALLYSRALREALREGCLGAYGSSSD